MAQAFDPLARPELINRTGRYRHINQLDLIYEGKQYDGRPDWWTGKDASGKEYPLRERKPCVIYRLPKAATQQVVRFLFGDGRFPSVSIPRPDDDAEPDDLYPELDEDEAEQLEKWLSALVKHGNLQPSMRAIASRAVSCCTSVAILEAIGGQLQLTFPKPQDCAVKFVDDNPWLDVERLVWCYEFEKEVADENGQPTSKRHLFRRDYDAAATYIYEDVELEHGKEVEWPKPKAEPHGLSFCPVLWFRNEPEHSDGIDGRSIYEDSSEEVEALDITLSKRHQGMIYLGAPQLVESSEEFEMAPDESGRTSKEDGGAYVGAQGVKRGKSGPARRIGPEYAWRYEGKAVNVQLIETSGKAFQVATDHVNDIRGRLLESWGVVLSSMTDTISRSVTTGAEMSARFLALAHAPLIALVQEYRHAWWAYGLKRMLSMCCRMAVDLANTDRRLAIPNTMQAAEILQRFYMDGQWLCPQLEPHWGKFFDPSSQEIVQIVEAAAKAKAAQLVASKTATERVAHDFGVEDINEELSEIEEDKAEAEEKAAADMERQQEALHTMVKGVAGGENAAGAGPGSRGKPPQVTGGGDGSPDAAARPPGSRGTSRRKPN